MKVTNKDTSKFLLLMFLLLQGCEQTKTRTDNHNTIFNKTVVITKRELTNKIINRDSLDFSIILNSLVGDYDSTYAKLPFTFNKDTLYSDIFINLLTGTKCNVNGIGKCKCFINQNGIANIVIKYQNCYPTILTLKYYTDGIYIFIHGEDAIYIDLKTDLFLYFISNMRDHLPTTTFNESFYFMDKELYPIVYCNSTRNGIQTVKGITKHVRQADKVLIYKTDYTALNKLNYFALNYKNMLQLKQDLKNNKVPILSEEPLVGELYENCSGPLWLKR